jgi:Flp pilus assembly protein CpaB
MLSTGGLLLFWSSSSETQSVLVARRDLPVGATLDASAVTTAHVKLTDALYASTVPAADASTIIGRQLAEPIHAGQLLARPQLSTGDMLASGERAMDIRLGKNSSSGGNLRPGDRVAIILTTNPGELNTATRIVLSGVRVHAVVRDDAAGFGRGSEQDEDAAVSSLTLIVAPEQALALASAKHNGELDVLLLPRVGK